MGRRLLNIFKYYSRSVKAIVFSKKKIAYSHFIVVGFYCGGEYELTPPQLATLMIILFKLI